MGYDSRRGVGELLNFLSLVLYGWHVETNLKPVLDGSLGGMDLLSNNPFPSIRFSIEMEKCSVGLVVFVGWLVKFSAGDPPLGGGNQVDCSLFFPQFWDF